MGPVCSRDILLLESTKKNRKIRAQSSSCGRQNSPTHSRQSWNFLKIWHMRSWLSKNLLTFLGLIFYLFIMLTHDYLREVTSVIITPWKESRNQDDLCKYWGTRGKIQLCPALSVLTARVIQFQVSL